MGVRSGNCAEAKKRAGHGKTFVLDSGNVLLRDYTSGTGNAHNEDIIHLSEPSVLLAIASNKCAQLSVGLPRIVP
jgi:hypothetical protein